MTTGPGRCASASWLLALICLVAIAAQLPALGRAEPGTATGLLTRSVANARELAAAFIDNSIGTIVPTADMEMNEAAWVGLGPFPVLVTRNVTLTSQHDDNTTWPLISFGFVPDKLQLQAGVYFIWTKIVCRRTREAPHFLAPGLDMLRPTLPAPSPNSSLEAFAHVQFNDMMIMNRGCIPVELAITMASQVLSISSRPTAVNGTQRARTQIVNNCTGVNNTGLRPTHQCFPVTNYYFDLALYGAYIPQTYVAQRSGYLVYCRNTPGQCEDMLETDCVTSLGPVECYWKTYGKLRAISSNSTNGTAANSTTGGNSSTNRGSPPQLANGTVIAVGGGSSNSGSSAQQQGDSSGGGSSSSSVVLGAVLGGVLGGLALLALGIAGTLLWRRRRGGTAGDSKDSFSSAENETAVAGCSSGGLPPTASLRGGNDLQPLAGGKSSKSLKSFSAIAAAALSALGKRPPSASPLSPNTADGSSGVRIDTGASEDAAAVAPATAPTTTTATALSTAQAAAAASAAAATAAAAAQSVGASGSLASAAGPTTDVVDGSTGGGPGGHGASTDSAAVTKGANAPYDVRQQAALLGDAGVGGWGGGAAQPSPAAPVTPWTPLQEGLELRVRATHVDGSSGAAAPGASVTDASAMASSGDSAGTVGTTTTGSASTSGGALSSSGGSSTSGSNEVKLLPITLGRGTFGRVVVGEFRGQRVAVKLVNLNLAAWAPPPLPAAAAVAPGGADTAARAAAPRGGAAAADAGDAAAAAPADGGTPPVVWAGAGTAGAATAEATRYLWEQSGSSLLAPRHHTLRMGLAAPDTDEAAAGALAGFAAVVAAAGPGAWGSPGAARMAQQQPQQPAWLPAASERWNPDVESTTVGAHGVDDAAADGADGAAATADGKHAAAVVAAEGDAAKAARVAAQQSVLAAPMEAAAASAPAGATASTAAHPDGSANSHLHWIVFPRDAAGAAAAVAAGGDAATESTLGCSLPPPVAAGPGQTAAASAAAAAVTLPPAAAVAGTMLVSDAQASLATASTLPPSTTPGAHGGPGLLTALPTLDAGGGGRRKLHNVGRGSGGAGKPVGGEEEGPDTVAGASTFCASSMGSQEPAHAASPPAKPKDQQGPLTAARHEASGLQRSFISEVEVLARIQHPNIVQLLAACIEPPQMCLVIELMDTSLERLLYGGGGGPGPRPLMPLGKVLHVAIQVCEALAYLHPTIIHRDLKPGNVLISKPNSATPIVKLADFGLSKLQTTVQFTWHADAGTAAYMAPETLNPYNHAVMHHVDMYAVGVLIWEMLAGQRPWAGLSIAQIAYSVGLMRQRPPLEGAPMPPLRCPPKLRALVEACWDQDPKRRPAASEALKELTLLQMKVARGLTLDDGINAAAAIQQSTPWHDG